MDLFNLRGYTVEWQKSDERHQCIGGWIEKTDLAGREFAMDQQVRTPQALFTSVCFNATYQMAAGPGRQAGFACQCFLFPRGKLVPDLLARAFF